MKTRTWLLGGVATGVGVRVRRRASQGPAAATDRWHVVTVNRPPDAVMTSGRLPEPLAALGDSIETQVRPAPAERGTELAARLRATAPGGVLEAPARIAGRDPRQALRRALRDAKMLLETGEVLRADEPPTTRPTLRSVPLALAARRARGEGRL